MWKKTRKKQYLYSDDNSSHNNNILQTKIKYVLTVCFFMCSHKNLSICPLKHFGVISFIFKCSQGLWNQLALDG